MRIGINTFLLTWPFTTNSSRVFKKINAWGFDTVEIAIGDPSDLDPLRVRRELDKAGLKCGSICAVLGPDRDLRGDATQQKNSKKYLKGVIDQAKILGARVVVGPVYSSVGRAEATPAALRKKQWKTVVKNLREIGAYAQKKNIKICIEPLNRFETDFINTADQAIQLAKAVRSPAMKVMLDTFHMNIEEKSPALAVKKAGKLLGHIHACGCDRGAPGKDQIDWKGIAKALQEIKYDGDVVIESFTTKVEMIARAASVWRKFEPSLDSIAVDGLRFLRGRLGRRPAARRAKRK